MVSTNWSPTTFVSTLWNNFLSIFGIKMDDTVAIMDDTKYTMDDSSSSVSPASTNWTNS